MTNISFKLLLKFQRISFFDGLNNFQNTKYLCANIEWILFLRFLYIGYFSMHPLLICSSTNNLLQQSNQLNDPHANTTTKSLCRAGVGVFVEHTFYMCGSLIIHFVVSTSFDRFAHPLHNCIHVNIWLYSVVEC